MDEDNNKTEKKNCVAEIESKLNESEFVILSDYRGLSANEISDLRNQIRDTGAEAKIYKNKLAKIAFDNTKMPYINEMLIGPTIFINTKGDAAKLSKTLIQFRKTFEQFKLKGGILQREHLDTVSIEELAKLPSRDELVAKVVGLIKGPLTSLVGSLSSPILGLNNVLNAIKNNKTGGDQ